MNDIELLAWNKRPLPKNSPPDKVLIYSVARVIYEQFERGELTKEQAQEMKYSTLMYLETIKGLAQSNSKIIRELSKATAPRSSLVRKDKAELLEVISRIEGVVTGLMKRYDDPIPKMLKVEEVKE